MTTTMAKLNMDELWAWAKDNLLLPELTGTQKQIGWASQIRLMYNKALLEYAKGWGSLRQPYVLEWIAGHTILHTQTEAHWWIDKRELGRLRLMQWEIDQDYLNWLSTSHPEIVQQIVVLRGVEEQAKRIRDRAKQQAEQQLLAAAEQAKGIIQRAQQQAQESIHKAYMDAIPPIGEISEISTYAKPGVKYNKGVRVVTTQGRHLDFYGSEREWITIVGADGISLGRNEQIQHAWHVACEHLLPAVRQAWKGKHKNETTEGKLAS